MVNILLLVPCILIFFIGSFGLGVIALPSAVKEFFSLKKIRPGRFFLVTFFGGCLLYFFTIQLSLGGRPRNYVHIYAFFLCFILLTILWAEKAARFASGRKKFLGALVVLCTVVFSIPNTVRYLRIKVGSPHPRPFPSTFVQAAEWSSKNTPEESVILHPLPLRYVCYFADRRAVLDNSSHSYLTFHLTSPQIEKRTGDIERFYRDPVLNAEMLKSYHVSYVWFGKPLESFELSSGDINKIFCYTDLGLKKIRKFQKSHYLELVYENPDFLIYAVRTIPVKKRQVFVLVEEEGQKTLTPFKVAK